jgi:hypothetical protein
VFPIAELAADVEKMRQQLPEQGDLFPEDDKKAAGDDLEMPVKQNARMK